MQPSSVRLTGSCTGRAWTTPPLSAAAELSFYFGYLKTYQKKTVPAWQVHSWWLKRNDLERTEEWDKQENTSPPCWMWKTKLKFTYNLSQLSLYHSSLGSSAHSSILSLNDEYWIKCTFLSSFILTIPCSWPRGQLQRSIKPDSLKTSMKQHRSEGQM